MATKTVSEVTAEEDSTVNASNVVDIRNYILELDDIEKKVIKVPQWGNIELEVRGMSGEERSLFMARMAMQGRDDLSEAQIADILSDAYADVIIQTVFEPGTDNHVFKNTDRDILQKKSGAALEYVAQIAMKLAGLDQASMNRIEGN